MIIDVRNRDITILFFRAVYKKIRITEKKRMSYSISYDSKIYLCKNFINDSNKFFLLELVSRMNSSEKKEFV